MPVLFLVMGGYAAIGVFVPRLRMNWRGTTKPVGPIAGAGFATVFVAFGVAMLSAKVNEDLFGANKIAVVVGFGLCVIGAIVDRIKYRDRKLAIRKTDRQEAGKQLDTLGSKSEQ